MYEGGGQQRVRQCTRGWSAKSKTNEGGGQQRVRQCTRDFYGDQNWLVL